MKDLSRRPPAAARGKDLASDAGCDGRLASAGCDGRLPSAGCDGRAKGETLPPGAAPRRAARGEGRRRRRPAPILPSAGTIAFRYAVFACVAMVCNLGVQRVILAAFRQGEQVAFGWAPRLLDWVLIDVLGVIRAGGGWRAEWSAPMALTVAIVIGTGVGLVVKYLLDKRWIFYDRSHGAEAHARRFTLYTLCGLVTTAIFWGAEVLAWSLTGDELAREAGAALGLILGYVAKYRLDRRFVFTPGCDPDAGPEPDADADAEKTAS